MSTEPTETPRGKDRRQRNEGYTGPERRQSERRAVDSPGDSPPQA